MADTRLKIQDIFDPNYFRQQNADLAGLNDQQLFQYFQNYVLKQSVSSSPTRKFSRFFDYDYFYSQNETVIASSFGINQTPPLATKGQVIQYFLDAGLPAGLSFSPDFDIQYYRSSNPDLGGLDNSQLFQHFLTSGLAEGRNFNRLIDLNYYRANNPDLANLNNLQLFDQFINTGINEGRLSIPLFDVNFYKANNPDLGDPQNSNRLQDQSNRSYINHFLSNGLKDTFTNPINGQKQGRKYSPFFDPDYYLSSNQDLVVAGLNREQAFNHFLTSGVNEGRRFSPFFDVNYYLANNADLRAAGLTPKQAFYHFINYGINEGRRPSLIYDPVYYLGANPDLAAAQTSFRKAFSDFQTTGFNLARPSSVFFDPEAIAPLLYVPSNTPTTNTPRLLNDWLLNATKWRDIPVGGTLTYSFVTATSAPLYQGTESGVSEVTPEIKNNVRNIMRTLSQYLPINFVEVPDRAPNFGRLRFMFSNGPASTPRDGVAYAYAYLPSDFPGSGLAGDVHLNPNRGLVDFGAGPGSFGYQVLLHEIGHALGLKHPFDYIYTLPGGKDNNTNTVMTYNDNPTGSLSYNGSFAVTPMSYDIRALQYLYGTSYYNIGDTVYKFDYNNFFGANQQNGKNGIKQTIWDAGGTDTLDFSSLPAVAGGYFFNMNEGGENTAQYALNGSTYYISNPVTTQPDIPVLTDSFGTTIAFGALIENLIGSPGDDEIFGNDLANNIYGGAGNDNITGGRGADILTGGDGSNEFVFALGDGGKTPGTADIISDFKPGIDKIGLSGGLPASSVAINQGTGANAADTLIWVPATGEYLAVLKNLPASFVGYNDLIPV